VTEGHPDKLCDQISDAILDAILKNDPYAHVACETAVAMGVVFVLGEVTCEGYVEIPDVVRRVIREAGRRATRNVSMASTTRPVASWCP